MNKKDFLDLLDETSHNISLTIGCIKGRMREKDIKHFDVQLRIINKIREWALDNTVNNKTILSLLDDARHYWIYEKPINANEQETIKSEEEILKFLEKQIEREG